MADDFARSQMTPNGDTSPDATHVVQKSLPKAASSARGQTSTEASLKLQSVRESQSLKLVVNYKE